MRFEQGGAGVASAVGWVGCGGAMLGGDVLLLRGDVPSLCGMAWLALWAWLTPCQRLGIFAVRS